MQGFPYGTEVMGDVDTLRASYARPIMLHSSYHFLGTHDIPNIPPSSDVTEISEYYGLF